jgi:hypothetical protein
MSPLAVAAIGGLLLGTVLSLFYPPMLYVWLMGHIHRIRKQGPVEAGKRAFVAWLLVFGTGNSGGDFRANFWLVGMHCPETLVDKRSPEGGLGEWRVYLLSWHGLWRSSTGAACRQIAGQSGNDFFASGAIGRRFPMRGRPWR